MIPAELIVLAIHALGTLITKSNVDTLTLKHSYILIVVGAMVANNHISTLLVSILTVGESGTLILA